MGRHIPGDAQSMVGSMVELAEAISQCDRPALESFIDAVIERLDVSDGDPDLEDDDPQGGAAEDEGEPEYHTVANYTDPIDQRKIRSTMGFGHIGRPVQS